GEIPVRISTYLKRNALPRSNLADRLLGHVDPHSESRGANYRRDLGVRRARRYILARVGHPFGNVSTDGSENVGVGQRFSRLIDLCLGGNYTGMSRGNLGLGRIYRLNRNRGIRASLVKLT